jgi:menaquinone-dependent protoporphyrinogen oxidase
MTVLVVYASRLGSTRGIAERIATVLCAEGVDALAVPVDDPRAQAPAAAFVVGSGVYAGHWLKEAVDFVQRRREQLRTVPVWLFSSGPVGATATKHDPSTVEDAVALSTLVGARGQRTFSGAFDRAAVAAAPFGRAERFIAKHLVPVGDFRDWTAIETWARGISQDLRARMPRGAVAAG